PTGGPNGVTFNVPTGIVAGVVTWSSPITYQLQPAAQMVQGAADSTAQNLVRIQTGVANGLPQRKCDFVSQGGIVGPGGVVSPQGLVITKTGTNLLITLTLTIQDENRKTLQTILTTSVTLRNSS
ncbi:MAG TPA: hypothetical protein VMU54_06120, partial [Planctomycetota bacterium]|nr:hypothetical protein [Planctomycetota bacterium]